MIAEVDPTQSLAVINQLRTNTAGLNAGIVTNGAGPAAGPTPHPGGPAAQAWPLTQISGATWTALTATQQRDAVREERRRELWMQGHHAGDMIRWGGAWSTTDEYGLQLAAGGCIPVPFLEEIANPNL
ncbi:MAG: RagB/SusD family nutrient uptake outer membrane protein [Gemmatimonadetes bacterium]|nr:RagB/SusD family nutrient uptake outer membrane protein [Gemmatimonadota bacterium]